MSFQSLQRRLQERRLQKALTVADIEALGEKRMSRIARAYASGAAGDEFTLRWNAERWAQIRLNLKILTDVSEINLQSTIENHSFEIPILLAPVAINRLW